MSHGTELEKALASSDRFRWMAGMKCAGEGPGEYRCTLATEYSDATQEIEEIKVFSVSIDDAPGWGWPSKKSGWAPDLSDPATLGCIRALLQESFGPTAHTVPVGDGWCAMIEDRVLGEGDTEAEAMARALI